MGSGGHVRQRSEDARTLYPSGGHTALPHRVHQYGIGGMDVQQPNRGNPYLEIACILH